MVGIQSLSRPMATITPFGVGSVPRKATTSGSCSLKSRSSFFPAWIAKTSPHNERGAAQLLVSVAFAPMAIRLAQGWCNVSAFISTCPTNGRFCAGTTGPAGQLYGGAQKPISTILGAQKGLEGLFVRAALKIRWSSAVTTSCRSVGAGLKPVPKLKPRWNVHSSDDDDYLGYAGESLSFVLGE